MKKGISGSAGLEKEKGGFSVAFLAAMGISVAVLFGYSAALNALKQKEELQLITDQAALSSDAALRGLNVGFPCEIAKRILQIHMASLQTCSIVGEETRIVGSLTYMGIVLTAEAWSAPKDRFNQ